MMSDFACSTGSLGCVARTDQLPAGTCAQPLSRLLLPCPAFCRRLPLSSAAPLTIECYMTVKPGPSGVVMRESTFIDLMSPKPRPTHSKHSGGWMGGFHASWVTSWPASSGTNCCCWENVDMWTLSQVPGC